MKGKRFIQSREKGEADSWEATGELSELFRSKKEGGGGKGVGRGGIGSQGPSAEWAVPSWMSVARVEDVRALDGEAGGAEAGAAEGEAGGVFGVAQADEPRLVGRGAVEGEQAATAAGHQQGGRDFPLVEKLAQTIESVALADGAEVERDGGVQHAGEGAGGVEEKVTADRRRGRLGGAATVLVQGGAEGGVKGAAGQGVEVKGEAEAGGGVGREGEGVAGGEAGEGGDLAGGVVAVEKGLEAI